MQPVVQTEFKGLSLGSPRKNAELDSGLLLVTSPVTVKVYETVRVADEISQTYEKIKLEVTKNRFTRDGNDRHDPRYNHLCGGHFTCTSTIVKNEYIKDSRYKNVTKIKRAVTSGTVQAIINGSYVQDLPINREGTASVSIEKYFDVLPEGQNVNGLCL
jgi:hypothetical protein